MKKTFHVRGITICAACIALCYVLPLALHPLGLGNLLSPMHIPVLLCGMLCGGWYGLFCGIAGPVLSSVLSGMPPAAMLSYMLPELAVYGLATGLAMRFVRTKNLYADMYISLVTAMLLGRVVGGIAKALFFLGSGQPFGIALWASGYFVGTLPGIIVHLLLIPLLVFTLMKAKLIPARYPQKVCQE